MAATVVGLLLVLSPRAFAEDPLSLQLRTISRVRLEGRHNVPAGELWQVLKTRRPGWLPWADQSPVRFDYLRADTAAIAAVYRQHGFLDASVSFRFVQKPKDVRNVGVVFEIHEGKRSTIRRVDFAGVVTYPEDALRKKLYSRPGKAFNPAYLVVDTSRISNAYQERGRLPSARGSFSRESLSVNMKFDVHEGPLYHFGEVYLSSPGEIQVKEKLVRRELLVKPGEVYKYSKVERSIERLYGTGLFNQVQITPLPDSSRALMDIDLRVHARRPRWVDTGISSGTSARLGVTAEWGHRNVDGSGLLTSTAGAVAVDGNGHFQLARIEARLVEPWLFGTRTQGSAVPYAERRDFRQDPRYVLRQATQGVTFTASRELNRFTTVGISQDNRWVHQTTEILQKGLSDSVAQAIQADFVPHYSTHRVQLFGDRDVRDNPFLTTRGSNQTATFEVAGGPLQGSSSFHKWQVFSSWYTPRRSGTVIATRVRAGLIRPFGPQTFTPDQVTDPDVARVPAEDRFALGGVNTIRGFDENSIPPSGGLVLMLASVEMRVPFKGPFGFELYADAGNVWARPEYIHQEDFDPRRSDEPLGPNDVRYVFGIGPRMDLPIGPLRLDFTWNLRPLPGRGPLVGRAQFAIGPSF